MKVIGKELRKDYCGGVYENWHCIYLENNLDDWNNQIIDIPDTTIFVTLKENRKGDE